jgi:NarL family two-component system sensor histidine kinase YdfH
VGLRLKTGQVAVNSRTENDLAAGRPVRWFLFIWVSLVYLVGWLERRNLHALLGGHVEVIIARGGPQATTGAAQAGYVPLAAAVPLLFIAAMIVHYVFHVLFIAGLWPRRARLAYFPVQALLLTLVAATDADIGLIFGLTLALCAEAAVAFTGRWAVLASAACAIASLAASLAWHGPAAFVWDTADYLSFALFLAGGSLLVVQQRQAHARQQQLNVSLAAAAARIEDLTRETERRRLARDLHDTLSQGLVGVTMQLRAAIAHLDRSDSDRTRVILSGAIQRAQDTLREARAAIVDLRTTPPDPGSGHQTGLGLLLATETNRFRSISDVPCSLEVDAGADPGPEHLDLAARVVGEALVNAARHAMARHVRVTAREADSMIVVEVADDGVGFDAGARPGEPAGYGLEGMREMAGNSGCHLEVISAPGLGSAIRLYLPISRGVTKPEAAPEPAGGTAELAE